MIDKTGTLTHGRAHIVATDVVADVSADEILRLAASLENGKVSEIEIAPGVVIRVVKAAIGKVIQPEPAPTDATPPGEESA